MTREEFDIIDALYFMTSYADLIKATGFEKLLLDNNLKSLVKKGWINGFEEPDALPLQWQDFENFKIENLYFLASKKGLLEHNSR